LNRVKATVYPVGDALSDIDDLSSHGRLAVTPVQEDQASAARRRR